jgi:hypothetical protein
VFFEQVNRALLFELCCDVDDGPAKECAAEARDDEGNEVACPGSRSIAIATRGRRLTVLQARKPVLMRWRTRAVVYSIRTVRYRSRHAQPPAEQTPPAHSVVWKPVAPSGTPAMLWTALVLCPNRHGILVSR